VRLISSLKGVTNVEVATALSWQNDIVDIYACSWVEGDANRPGLVTLDAIHDGIENVSALVISLNGLRNSLHCLVATILEASLIKKGEKNKQTNKQTKNGSTSN